MRLVQDLNLPESHEKLLSEHGPLKWPVCVTEVLWPAVRRHPWVGLPDRLVQRSPHQRRDPVRRVVTEPEPAAGELMVGSGDQGFGSGRLDL